MLTLPLQLPPCGACTNLVTSFEAGVERTKRGKLEGGDAAWEEKSGQKYATSEVTSNQAEHCTVGDDVQPGQMAISGQKPS